MNVTAIGAKITGLRRIHSSYIDGHRPTSRRHHSYFNIHINVETLTLFNTLNDRNAEIELISVQKLN